jgi:hypothetical protein
MRALGIDFGLKRLGFAISDASGTLARPLATEAVAGGAEAWQPLAEALGAQPEPNDRTARILWALAQVDREKLYRALRLRLAKAADEAIRRPSAAAAAEVGATAAWVLPALVELFGRQAEARELAAQVAAGRFAAVQALLEGM